MTEQENIRKCKICGRPYEQKTIGLNDFVRHLWVAQCECEEQARIAEEKRKEEQKRYEEAKKKANVLKDALNCPLITPLFKTKTFDNLSDRNKNVEFCQKYAQEFNKKTSTGIFMIGNVGTGKTTLQACICNELEKRGVICMLTTFSALLDYFIESCDITNNVKTSNLFKTLTCFDYIVLDDVGREKYTDKRLEFAFRIIDTLMNYNVVVSITGNYETVQKLKTIDEYKAILDRLSDMCGHAMYFDGESYRGKGYNC